MTEYIVLEKNGAGWTEAGVESASSPKAAIRGFVNDLKVAPAAEYVAVPSRSWKPEPVKVERTVKIG